MADGTRRQGKHGWDMGYDRLGDQAGIAASWAKWADEGGSQRSSKSD
jgi:hypothetical protein